MIGLSLLKKFFFLLNLVAAAALLASSFASIVNPDKFWIFAFFGLAYPFLLSINIFFIFFWIVVRIRFALLSVLCVLATGYTFSHYFSFHFASPSQLKNKDAIRVMTYNVRNFDLYNWTHNMETRKNMMDMIEKQKPDIACFQEFYSSDKGDFTNVSFLRNQLKFKYFQFVPTTTLRNQDHWGLAIFSNYPIVKKGDIAFHMSTNNSCIYSDINVNGTIVRVYNIHLQSIHFKEKDYAYIEQVSENQDIDLASSKNIFRKLKKAFKIRARQTLLIAEHIRTSTYPVIICGDFNDPPSSFSYKEISSGLNDSFLEAGWGIGHTYSGILPIFRIDYILQDSHFKVMKYETIHNNYSDHYPVFSNLLLK